MGTSSKRNHHHLIYPRKDYTTSLERKFRSLPCFIIEIDKEVHSLLHAISEPPTKPTVADMREAIRRHTLKDCGCY